MFVYQIRCKQTLAEDQATSREYIFANQMAKSTLCIGDRVAFRKHRKQGIVKSACGTIVDIEHDIDKVTWAHGGLSPCNVTVDIDAIGGVRRVKTSMRKLIKIV